MKTRQSHVVTLSSQAVKALTELESLTGYNQFLFPGNDPTKPISEVTLTKVLKLLWPEYRIGAVISSALWQMNTGSFVMM